MISNPLSWFVTGNIVDQFIYEGGERLYHFSPKDNGLSEIRDYNVVFSADNEQHALDVLRRALEFEIECYEKYREWSHASKRARGTEFRERNEKIKQKRLRIIRAIEAGKVKVTEAPTNQFYLVGWASNDTVT